MKTQTFTILFASLLLLASCSNQIEYETIEKNEDFRASITQGSFVELNSGHTYYNYIPGNGTPLVLVPSFSVPCYQWDHTIEMALEKGIPVLSLDLYGRGNSSNPDTTYSVELFADQVIQLLDHLEIKEKINIAGISMGGRVVSQIAANHPNRINKLILVSPGGFLNTSTIINSEGNNIVSDEEIKEFIATDFPTRAEGQLEDFYKKDELDWWIDLYRPLLFHKHFARALISTRKNERSIMRENVMVGLYDFPVEFIWGAKDVVFPVEECCKNALNWIPRSEFHILDSCGHMPHIEKTEEFDRILFDNILK
ncbi:MAG: alpha/beta hydrolase [Flavobacteriales bacterium]|jgi:pimeloyl-ACP methyl ester carboxylesterase|nr:alpha/beta hydrolase [Flavobacteriales bacterium]